MLLIGGIVLFLVVVAVVAFFVEDGGGIMIYHIAQIKLYIAFKYMYGVDLSVGPRPVAHIVLPKAIPHYHRF